MAARSCTPVPSRRALFGAAALLPAVVAAPALAQHATPHDGPQFLAWEREVARHMQESSTVQDESDGMDAWHRGWASMVRILSTPPRSRIAAAVKLRAVLHPEIGLFAAGSSEHDQPCLEQVATFLAQEA